MNILADIESLFNVELSFTELAKQMLSESVKVQKDIASIDEATGISEPQIQSTLEVLGFNPSRKLTPQQVRNLSKLSRIQFGATFSVPGAGKTTEAIAFWLLHRKEGQKLMVICPKSAFPAWEEQIQVCLPNHNLNVKRLTQGSSRIEDDLAFNEQDVYLISYQQFNRCSNIIANYLDQNPTFVFVDESHRMKGGDRTDTGRQIQRISHLPVGKLIMSGTPMPQGIADLLPQYSFLFPTDGNLNVDNVKEKLKRVYVRTTKDELLNPEDFPLKFIRTPIPLNESQRHLYNLIRSEELRQTSGVANNARRLYRHLGKSYIRLLQVVTNPSLLLKTIYDFPDALREAIEYGESNKLSYTVMKARKLAKEGKKVLIWSGFVENVEILTQMLSDLGAKCIHGGVEAGSEEEENTRERIIKDFHDDPNMQVLVANPAACSEGISLHMICHHAIYVDRGYNAAQFLQSMDRIHRLGLPKGIETIIEIVHSPNSIDDLIDIRLIEKVKRMSEIMEDPSLNIEPVTVELDEEGFDEEDAKQLLRHLKGQL
ncbi:DEAD/DEAH box helicase [Chitinophaga silvatica]|uniref:DEAD/DEAH box helicase n=1 Tax=Chitinophaga silvatica TaxID=2282649 RepID=UPI001314AFAA|nr:SNF2-related protein [Chitinophaga silvatica]